MNIHWDPFSYPSSTLKNVHVVL